HPSRWKAAGLTGCFVKAPCACQTYEVLEQKLANPETKTPKNPFGNHDRHSRTSVGESCWSRNRMPSSPLPPAAKPLRGRRATPHDEVTTAPQRASRSRLSFVMVTSVSVCNALKARADMVVSCLKVNSWHRSRVG